MCLAVPGKVVEWIGRDGVFAEAWIEFGGVRRRVSMACTPGVLEGEFVLVHAGIAIGIVDAIEAAHILEMWQEQSLDSSQQDETL